MRDPEKEILPSAEQPAETDELTWLMTNRFKFGTIARDHHREHGRGAMVIKAIGDEFSEETPFAYAPQARITSQEDEVSQQLARIVDTYDPEKQFVAVFVRPGDEYTFSTYQIRVGENLEDRVEPGQRGEQTKNPDQPRPDLETLMEWEAEGGCEATDGCWVEPDGACPHGHRSWLLELGLI
jgi:hypothetical protein